jgi:hypothetical protein
MTHNRGRGPTMRTSGPDHLLFSLSTFPAGWLLVPCYLSAGTPVGANAAIRAVVNEQVGSLPARPSPSQEPQ